MSHKDLIASLKHQVENFEAEPFDPITSFYTDIPPLPPPPTVARLPVPAGGYPEDHFWPEEVERLQGISGEESQC